MAPPQPFTEPEHHPARRRRSGSRLPRENPLPNTHNERRLRSAQLCILFFIDAIYSSSFMHNCKQSSFVFNGQLFRQFAELLLNNTKSVCPAFCALEVEIKSLLFVLVVGNKYLFSLSNIFPSSMTTEDNVSLTLGLVSLSII